MAAVKILLVDNDPQYLASLRAVVEASGLMAVPADCNDPFASALQLWGEHPDLKAAIVDLGIPAPSRGKSESTQVGFDLIAELRRRRPEARLAAHTGQRVDLYQVQDQERAQQLEADYIPKGASLTTFLQKVLNSAQASAVVPEGDAEEEADERRHERDYQWGLHDPKVRLLYGGQIIVVHEQKALAAGPTLRDAVENARARPDCPPRRQLTLVAVPLLCASPDGPYAWCLDDPRVQESYGGLVAAIKGREVVAAGNSRAEAQQNAQQTLPSPTAADLTYVLIPYVLGGPSC